jgi:AbrB family looped-hinge helix DNA binding protein
MIGRITLDKAGRIVLPKPVRDELQLEAGDTLELESSGDKITLRPARGNAQLRKKHGVWVLRSGEPLTEETVERTAREIRRERDERIWGKRS